MQLKNSIDRYGLIAIAFHWSIAIAVVALFALGLWMDDLGYQSKWYRTAPHLHKSFGVLVVSLMLIRLVWKINQPSPHAVSTHKKWERLLAKITHVLFYVFICSMLISGYLITTAKGQALEVFNLFSIPATITHIENLEDYAGEVHEIIAFTIITLACLHGLAALKHHLLDKDKTLLRMLGRSE